MHVVGQEHEVFRQRNTVGGLADSEVNAELGPGHFRQIRAQQVSHGRTERQSAGIERNLVEKGLLDNVADTRGAVVVEKFVHVVLVFLAGIFLQEVEQALAFFRRQVQDLLAHGPVVGEVVVLEGAVRLDVEVVAEFALAEFKQEVGFVEVEGAVVVAAVEAQRGVEYADSAVAEGAVQHVARGHGHQADAGAVGEGLLGRQARRAEQEDEYGKKTEMHGW